MLTIVVLALLLAAEAAAFTVGPSLSPTRTATSHSAPRATQVRMCSEGQDAVTRRTAICRMAVHATAVGAPATAFAAEQNGVPPVDPAWAAHDGPFTDRLSRPPCLLLCFFQGAPCPRVHRADLGRRGWCGSDFAGFKQTASGLKYKDVLEGTGASPQAADTVRAHYCGYLLTGEIFDTSYRPALFPFRSVDACVRAAVLLGRVCFLR